MSLTCVTLGALMTLAALSCSGSTSGQQDGGPDGSTADRVTMDRMKSGDRPGQTDGPTLSDACPPPSGGPTLAELSVTGASGGLVPPFSAAATDYYVQCSPGTNDLTVTMKAESGAESFLMQPTRSHAAASQTVKASVMEGQAVVVAVQKGSAATEYWVRCLPHDFPQMTWTVARPGAAPGYYLVGNMLPQTGPSYAMVLDGNGAPVWYHHLPNNGVVNVDDVVPGAISFCPNVRLTQLLRYEVHHLSPPSVSYASPLEPDGGPMPEDDHDLRLLRNGDYAVLTNVFSKGFNLTGLSATEPDGGLEPITATNATIQDCSVVEFDPKTGAVVWSWLGSDHFDPRQVTTILPGAQGPIYDVFHCNSIDEDPATGNLLVSARHLDSVFYIDKATKNVVWKAGGRRSSKDPGTTFVSVPSQFLRQHDARLQPGWQESCQGGSGQLSVFDDRTYVPGAVARAVLFNVVVGPGDGGTVVEGGCGDAAPPEGGVPGEAVVAWESIGTHPSQAMGSFRIYPDGSRLIGWGVGGPSDPVFSELDENGNTLVQLFFKGGVGSYRAVKSPLCNFDLQVLRTTAGQ